MEGAKVPVMTPAAYDATTGMPSPNGYASRCVVGVQSMDVEHETVRTLLHRGPVTVDPGTTVRAVAQILAEELIGAVVVRHERPEEAPYRYTIGVVSERDISHAIARGLDPDTTCAVDVMTWELADAEPDDSILRAAVRMIANEVRHLPVMEGDALIGVVSERDVLRALTEALHDRRQAT